MATIEERAIAAFNVINGREYKCALSESQVSKQLYEQVKKEYSIAKNAFVQGVMYQRKIDIEKACEWFLSQIDYDNSGRSCRVFFTDSVDRFRKAMEE